MRGRNRGERGDNVEMGDKGEIGDICGMGKVVVVR